MKRGSRFNNPASWGPRVLIGHLRPLSMGTTTVLDTKSHHVRHWVDGGPTALLNLALLCAHHHTVVHQHDLTATVTAYDVTWHT